MLIGVKSGSQASVPPRVFSLVDYSPATAVPPTENLPVRAKAAPDVAVAAAKPGRDGDKSGAFSPVDKEILIQPPSATFYKSSEVSHLAQLELPLEGVLFADDLSLSGHLVLDIAISNVGKVVNIEVVEASDVSGALRARMLPLLKDAPFSPAYKDGIAVNSVRRVEFTLGLVLGDPSFGFNSPVSPGFRPRMDARGNILKVQPKID